eukprot:3331355-Lingulodinium_polyedra.AAC.1
MIKEVQRYLWISAGWVIKASSHTYCAVAADAKKYQFHALQGAFIDGPPKAQASTCSAALSRSMA